MGIGKGCRRPRVKFLIEKNEFKKCRYSMNQKERGLSWDTQYEMSHYQIWGCSCIDFLRSTPFFYYTSLARKIIGA